MAGRRPRRRILRRYGRGCPVLQPLQFEWCPTQKEFVIRLNVQGGGWPYGKSCIFQTTSTCFVCNRHLVCIAKARPCSRALQVSLDYEDPPPNPERAFARPLEKRPRSPSFLVVAFSEAIGSSVWCTGSPPPFRGGDSRSSVGASWRAHRGA